MMIRRVAAGAVLALSLSGTSAFAQAQATVPSGAAPSPQATSGATAATARPSAPVVASPDVPRSEAVAPPALPAVPAAPVVAAAPPERPMDVFSSRGGSLPSGIAYLQSQGVKVTSLGEEGGAKAYLGEAANGRDQVFYVPPENGDYMAVGLLFRSGGGNVTNVQIEGMLRRFQNAAKSAKDVDVTGLKEMPKESAPDEASPLPIMDWFRSQGMSVTPFGNREGGLDAYLVETPKALGNERGVMQAFYVMPDPHYAVAGMLSKRGSNVTGLQIAAMRIKEQNQEAVDQAPKSSAVVPGVVQPSVPKATVDQILTSNDRAAKSAVVQPDPLATMPGHPAPKPSLAPSRRSEVPAPRLPDVALSSRPASAADEYRSRFDKGQFVESLKTAVWFAVGDKNAPILYMVVDPQCPFCHATWQELKPLVFARKLQVRIVMIAGLKGSYPLAVSILSRPEPSVAWLAGEGSIQGVPIAPGPLPGSGGWIKVSRMLDVNNHFTDRYAINRTPFMAYVSPTGTLYSTLGLPADINAFLAAIR